MLVAVTWVCNLSCSYCFVREADLMKSGRRMTPTLARRVVDALDEGLTNVGVIDIHLYGGEPLANLPAIEAMVEQEARATAADRAVAAGPDAAQFLPLFPLPGTPLARSDGSYEPHPDDVRDAAAATRAFYEHPFTRRRLEAAVDRGGVPGLLARGTLRKRVAVGGGHAAS